MVFRHGAKKTVFSEFACGKKGPGQVFRKKGKKEIVTNQAELFSFFSIYRLISGKLKKPDPLFSTSAILYSVPNHGTILNLKPIAIKAGELIFVLGKNGAGKTSLLSILAGHLVPSEGDLFWKGGKIKPLKDRLMKGFEGIELVKQEPDLNPFLTVQEELEKSTRHLPEKEAAGKLNFLIKTLKIKSLLSQKTGNLSGGEKRRLGIALALAKSCELLLLDEPFADLDSENRMLLASVLSDLKEIPDLAVVIVSHIGTAATGLANQIWTMKQGKWIEKWSPGPDDFYPKKSLTARLLGMKNILEKKFFPLLPYPEGSDWLKVKPEQVRTEPSTGSFELGDWQFLAAERREDGMVLIWKKRSRDQFLESRPEVAQIKPSPGQICRLFL